MEVFPKHIKIEILYDIELEKITKKASEEAMVSEGIRFVNMLDFIFTSYPGIRKTYPPGKLGLLLNNKPPKDSDILRDGDEIVLKTEE